MRDPSSPPQEEKKESGIPTPTIRRNVSVEQTVLEDTTAIQRLVEYFVVISCQPRWDENDTTTSPQTAKRPSTPERSRSRPSTPERRRPATPERRRSRPSTPEQTRTKPHQMNTKTKPNFADKLTQGTKRFNESIQNTFKKKEVSGTERAIQRTLSTDEPPESREETLQPPKPLGTWKREESDITDGNIRVPQGASERNTFQPKVTARFPPTDHADNPLNPMITHFCHPLGDVVLPTTEYQKPKVHHFVLTNEKGRKVYGTCLTFYEEYYPSDGSGMRSKSLVHENSDRDIEVTVQDDVSETELYLPRCLCILSIWPYVRAFRKYLAQLYRLATATDCMTAPIERYIVNICMEIPAPPPGAFEVQVNILDLVIRFWSPPARLPIAYVALPYQTLFDCLDIETILHLWYCLTMERKVLLVSSQCSLLTVCSEILCSLLYPMKWSHLYVPVLPRFLCPMLDAPVPYLCGVTRENWQHTQQFVSAETIVVDLDQNSLMFGEETQPLPAIPGKKWMKLQSSLNDIAGHLFWETRGLEKEYRDFADDKITEWNFKKVARERAETIWNEKIETYDQAFDYQSTPDSRKAKSDETIEREQSLWDKVQECFLRFFVAVFKHYREFIHIPDAAATPLPMSPNANEFQKWTKRRYFDRDGFLGSQNVLYLPFLSELCATQQFDDFITKRLYNPEMPEIIFFDQSIDAKLNRSRLKFSKVETPFLQSAKAHKVLKSFVAVEPNVNYLPREGPFVYKMWPETFDPNLFSKPRPIPSIITAEFDRQASLFSKLRQHHSPDKDIDDELYLFYGSDFDMHPEGMAFTVYFFTYSAVIGREWRDYQLKMRELEMVGGPMNVSALDVMEIAPYDEGVVSDLTLGVLDSCNPEMRLAQQVVDCTPCPQYAGHLNSQAQEAYNVISKFALNQIERMNNMTGSLLDDDEGLAEYEEARDVAVAQLDLAFDSLKAMETRGFLSDPDIFRSLMEACSRCGDTTRALELIEMMKRDGVADKEVLACFMNAFCHSGGDGMGSVRNATGGTDAYSDLLRRKLEAVGGTPRGTSIRGSVFSESGSESGYSDLFSDSGSVSSQSTSASKRSSLMEWLVPPSNMSLMKKKKKKKRKKKKSKKPLSEELALTDRLSKQIILGESLLEFLYPDLSLDTNGDACPSCSHIMSEQEIMNGWLPCEFEDYRTTCPRCNHRFVPKFSVSCSAPTFEGSQGKGTPLFCEFLSPWVLRKELHHVIRMENGIDTILNPAWRSGTDIQATLWWNLIAMLQRHELPYSFLLQGSFKNRLINPVPQD
mmetsp:Transcript_41425/g.99789  ORF Transcript_41425/g.99789 Transcript_41425/m.99789 type:complete len:1287 (-) Transcript_41425:38-3898(-)